jgi:predicted DNA-binding antitoxin AbrB/MazE fold protein
MAQRPPGLVGGDHVMTTTIEAVYENGILRPLTPLALPEGQHVQVSVESEEAKQDQGSAAILAEIAALPIEGAGDRMTSQIHDQVLYGTPNQP